MSRNWLCQSFLKPNFIPFFFYNVSQHCCGWNGTWQQVHNVRLMGYGLTTFAIKYVFIISFDIVRCSLKICTRKTSLIKYWLDWLFAMPILYEHRIHRIHNHFKNHRYHHVVKLNLTIPSQMTNTWVLLKNIPFCFKMKTTQNDEEEKKKKHTNISRMFTMWGGTQYICKGSLPKSSCAFSCHAIVIAVCDVSRD